MALQSISSAAALPIALAVIPSLPRPYLKRLVELAIDRLDEMDGDPDLEDTDQDRCLAGDDGVFDGPIIWSDALGFSSRPSNYAFGMTEDMETEAWPEFTGEAA